MAGALLLTATMLTAGATPPAAAEPQDREPALTGTVTLVTGDRVTVTDGLSARVEPGEGRKDVTFSTHLSGGRLRVVPSDAVPLLGDGRLDPRLFEVTTLLEYGYDDRRPALPLIVTGTPAPRGLTGASGIRTLGAVGGFAVQERRSDAGRFWKDITGGRAKIWLDGKRRVSLDASVKQIGAPAAWARGYTGAGAKVAVLDTGIDATHPDLAGKVSAREDFTETPDERDVVGHGTHVASTIAGSGAASGGRYRGVAPDATLLDGKVCESLYCSDSAILAGMQWAAEQGAQVVNMSLGRPDTPESDPLEQAVETLTEKYGTLFVVAAGNNGQDRGIDSPAATDAALAVGAVSKSDEPAPFSAKGPRVGDGGLKPDITAPGVDITAARGKDSPGTGSYVSKSGTSMATPHVAGTAALLVGRHPDWKAATLKAALMGSAKPDPKIGIFTQGAGRVDADRVTTQELTTEPPGLGFGTRQWPHDDDQPITKKLVYRNHLATPVTLALEARAGKAFTVTPSTLIVPAGGQAEASVTADTGADVADGFLGGYIVATGSDGVSVSTPVAVEKEIESYDLTVQHTDRQGEPTGLYEMSIWRLDADQSPIVVFGGESTITLRLPKGRWLLDTAILSEDGVTQLVHPGLNLDKSQTVAADARLGRPLSVKPPRADAVSLLSEVIFQVKRPDGGVESSGSISRDWDHRFTAQLGPDRDYEGFLTKVAGQWAASKSGSPYAYRLAWFVRGRMVTGFHREVAQKDLAAIHTDYARHLPDAQAESASRAWPRDAAIFSYLAPTPFGTPFTQTEYVNTDDGIRWQRFLWEYGADGRVNRFESGFARYAPGRETTERWNRGVFGPSVPLGDQLGGVSAGRAGDVISTDLWMYGDGRGSLGYSSRATEHTALYRDGELVGEVPSLTADFPVPAGAATYRLVAEAERGAPAVLSTRSSIAWTFRSGNTGDAPVRLPVSVVRFTPALDAQNAAPAGRPFAVPVTVQPLPGSTAGHSRRLSVDVSYDDGTTWAKAEVRDSKVILRHPAGDGFVSLRAKSSDASGDTVEQTVIRAYRIAATA
ncbi:S8 family serine peptidase [Nonomuraea sp. NEAU-A123]|uniref:S8 family peptidase n=1 Tax=Nonomuraea sp. NEAU-A123 TaxID=2839649 RepID=UPI001BE3D255|nr:S8 family serine peptidase [Nonomuraea sp. NEAU-A123]MBT2227919.1 S8 family serine peptidase [Nonomuraea sp. NEAU-A123]